MNNGDHVALGERICINSCLNLVGRLGNSAKYNPGQSALMTQHVIVGHLGGRMGAEQESAARRSDNAAEIMAMGHEGKRNNGQWVLAKRVAAVS